MAKRPTIGDVAYQARVSTATVSHVINGTRHVEKETQQKVLRAIELLEYRPSSVARSLTTNQTHSIGVLVSDTANSFFGDVLRGVDDVLRLVNYSQVVCNTDEILERENQYLNLLLSQRVDGIITVATSQRWEAITRADILHTPIVFVDRMFEGWDGPFVGVNNRAAAYTGTMHLVDCGHVNIGILAGSQRLSTMKERLAGFQQVLEEHRILLPEEWVVSSPLSVEDGRESAMKILSLSHRPTALFISNNYLSLGALLAIKDLGLRCPEDISLVGFDDHQWATVSCPPLTVIRQPSRSLGQVAAEMVLHLIKGEALPQAQVSLDCELVVRQSCSAPH